MSTVVLIVLYSAYGVGATFTQITGFTTMESCLKTAKTAYPNTALSGYSTVCLEFKK